MNTVAVKTVAYNFGVYKIWSVAGKVTMAKCAKTGKFVGNTMASKALWHNRNNECLSCTADNLILVNRFKKVDAKINWFAILGSLFFAMLFVLILVFALAAFAANPKTVFLSGLIVVAMGSCFSLIIAENKHFIVKIA